MFDILHDNPLAVLYFMAGWFAAGIHFIQVFIPSANKKPRRTLIESILLFFFWPIALIIAIIFAMVEVIRIIWRNEI